jgi:hypothetical protein
MRKWRKRSWLCPLAVTMMLLGFIAVGADTIADPTDTASVPLAAASADSNDLRWDLARAFQFDWVSAELSAKVVPGADANAPARTVIVSVGLTVLDVKGLVILDMNSPGIIQVLDQRGNPVEYQAARSDQTRRYDSRSWYWNNSGAVITTPLGPFDVAFRLSADPRQSAPSSLSQVQGYIYAIYADGVVGLDVPFDPNYGWHQAPAVPGLMACVDPATPPCPWPLKEIKVAGPDSTGTFYRPATPVPLYKYQTWVKVKAGGPMMGLNDPGGFYPRASNPLGDYALVRTELYASKKDFSDYLFTQWVLSDPLGDRGASCNGEKEQVPGDVTYDSIRHIIAVHPVEVKIPFVLKNIPIPKPR